MRNVYLGLVVISTVLVLWACGGNQAMNSNSENSENNQNMETQTTKIIPSDKYITNNGELHVSVLGHASLMFEYQGKIIYVDPFSDVADFSTLPKADLILLTHEHADHLDTAAINHIKKADTEYFVSSVCNDRLGYGQVMNNGDAKSFADINIQAVPAYNMVHKTPQGAFYHPKGRGNGYVLTFGDKKVYVAGDTENIPEMKNLQDIYIAFLPKNLPYTMSDEMFIDAVSNVKPTYLYPYHFSDFDENKLVSAMKADNVKLLLRSMSNK